MEDGFIGIDLAIAKRKRLPVSVCTWRDGRLVPKPLRLLPLEPPRGHGNMDVLDEARVSQFVEQARDYVVNVCRDLGLKPRRIAIDAPSGPCPEGMTRRSAEAALDQAKISCYSTPTASDFELILEKVRKHLAAGGPENRLPHGNQLWMLVGFRLFAKLAEVAPCLEVFPQATARVLGSGQIHKFKTGGVEAQLSEAAKYTGWPSDDLSGPDFSDIAFGPAHDRLDAYLSAWVAALEETDRWSFGSPPEALIWVPRPGSADYAPPRLPEKRAAPRLRPSPRPISAELSRDCPCCGEFVFKRWPWGWDGHAAHRCPGLGETDPELRKAEFMRRFGSLFPSAGT